MMIHHDDVADSESGAWWHPRPAVYANVRGKGKGDGKMQTERRRVRVSDNTVYKTSRSGELEKKRGLWRRGS